MLVMTRRVTMLGISRWTGKGGSDRTVQRFCATVIPWATLLGVFFRHHAYRPGEDSLLVGDAVVATKAGKHPHGLDPFFPSLYGKPVPGLACFTCSLVSTPQRRSFPMRVEQEEDVYLVDCPFDGETLLAEVTFVPGQEILLGTHLLLRYRLAIDFPARTVQLERVA